MVTEVAPIAIDLFCGAGGMSLGFEQAGFDVRFATDIDPVHVTTYSENFPGCSVFRKDVRKLTGEAIRDAGRVQRRDIAVVFGGPPCQAFSAGGKHDRGDVRRRLIYQFARLVGELRPQYFVLENVGRLFSKQHRDTLKRLINQFHRAGYNVRDAVTLDAADFGVPQRRHRAFLLGAREGLVLPKYPRPRTTPPPSVWDALGDLPEVSSYATLLDTDIYEGDLGDPTTYAARFRVTPHRRSHLAPKRVGLSGCQRTVHARGIERRFAATPQGAVEPISRFFRLHPDGLSSTLRAGTGNDRGSHTAPRPIHPFAPRCITVREAARLHSFPDWFRFNPTKWHGFRQVGNSVPPLLALAVAKQIRRLAE